jgi:hypothetical protein
MLSFVGSLEVFVAVEPCDCAKALRLGRNWCSLLVDFAMSFGESGADILIDFRKLEIAAC